jgi:hypothetical protein
MGRIVSLKQNFPQIWRVIVSEFPSCKDTLLPVGKVYKYT